MLLPKSIYSFTLEVKTYQQCYWPKATFGCIHLEETNYTQPCSKYVAAPKRNQPIHTCLYRFESHKYLKILIAKIPRQLGSCQHTKKVRGEKKEGC